MSCRNISYSDYDYKTTRSQTSYNRLMKNRTRITRREDDKKYCQEGLLDYEENNEEYYYKK